MHSYILFKSRQASSSNTTFRQWPWMDLDFPYINYDELRLLLSTVAEEELQNQEDACIPPENLSRNKGREINLGSCRCKDIRVKGQALITNWNFYLFVRPRCHHRAVTTLYPILYTLCFYFFSLSKCCTYTFEKICSCMMGQGYFNGKRSSKNQKITLCELVQPIFNDYYFLIYSMRHDALVKCY